MTNLRIFACGGTGINVAKTVADTRKGEGAIRGNTVYIDTSNSNMLEGFEKEERYIIPNVDGSGSDRAENAKAIRAQLESDNFLKLYEPGRFNIVTFSNSGGTGAVAAAYIIHDLLKHNIPVVAVSVSTLESTRAANNCLESLATLEKVARATKRPVPMYHVVQAKQEDRSKADDNLCHAIYNLCLVMSGMNRELDSQDIENFLRYDKHCDVKPALSNLMFFANNDTDIDSYHALTTLDILREGGEDSPVENKTHYRAVGYTNAKIDLGFTVINTMNGVLERYETIKEATLVDKGTVGGLGDVVEHDDDEDFMVC